jgi:hypothetical protein
LDTIQCSNFNTLPSYFLWQTAQFIWLLSWSLVNELIFSILFK